MGKESIFKKETQVITGVIRFSYANVWEPYGQGEEKKYSVSLLIPKSDTKTIENIKTAIENANKKGEENIYKSKKVKNIFEILHDGDEEEMRKGQKTLTTLVATT